MGLAVLVEPRDDSELALDEIELVPGESFGSTDRETDTLLFCLRGEGALRVEDDAHVLTPGSAALVLAGETPQLTTGTDGLTLLAARIGRGAEQHAPLGAREFVATSGGRGQRATGQRSFDVLLGPHNGSLRATMFVGFVPPGKAPWHYHLYEEIVVILEGSARLHREESVETLAPGAACRLRSHEPHILENTGSDALELLGVFTPAGSPAAAYLAPRNFGT